MTRLSPFDSETEDHLNAVLSSAGAIPPEEDTNNLDIELSGIQKIFKARGAGLEAAASKISDLMESSKDDIALRAAEIAMKVQGVYADIDKGKKHIPSVTINILSAGDSNQNNLINLIMPTV